MKPKEFQRYLERDLERCYHCGIGDQTLVPQHRAGRGMGGSKARAHRPSNIITLCSIANGLLESDADFAQVGRDNGWKISSWEDPLAIPVRDLMSAEWYLLDDQGSRSITETRIKIS